VKINYLYAVTPGGFVNDVQHYIRGWSWGNLDVYTFRLLPNERGVYRYRHRDSYSDLQNNMHYTLQAITPLPSYSIINKEPKLTLITVVLFVFFFRVLDICCKCRTCHDNAHIKKAHQNHRQEPSKFIYHSVHQSYVGTLCHFIWVFITTKWPLHSNSSGV
jgi:hypothetical protein